MSDFLNTIRSTAAGRERLELFDSLPPTLSPRLQWIEKHGVWTKRSEFVDFHQPEAAWTATAAGLTGTGPTEDAAIVELAKRMGIKLWMEEAL